MTMLCAVAAGFAATTVFADGKILDLPFVRAISGPPSGWNNPYGPVVQTDIALASNSVIEAEVELTSLASTEAAALFCSRVASKQQAFFVAHDASKGWLYSYNNEAVYGEKARAEVRYQLKATAEGLWVNGTKQVSTSPASFVLPARLTLFTSHTYDPETDTYTYNKGTGGSKCRLYWLKVSTPDADGKLELTANLTPCVTAEGRVGLYDSVSKKTFTSSVEASPLATDFTVSAKDGVVGLTNILSIARASQRNGTTLAAKSQQVNVNIEPGVYDLKDVGMADTTHLLADLAYSGSIRGMGADPKDTILLGGGEASDKRVISIGYMTLTNLTVTGGYRSTNDKGAGVQASKSQWNPSAVLGCVVSNNYCAGRVTGNEGAGICGAWTVRGCLIADNRHEYTGGGLASFNSVEDCIFRNNRAGSGGGGGASGASSTFSGCTFENNSATGQGAAVNGAATMTDCIVVNHIASQSVVMDAKMIRCTIADCGAADDSSKQPFRCVYNSKATANSAVNCVFDGIVLSNAADQVIGKYQLVNCTVRGAKNAVNGPLAATATAVNTIVADNLPYDVVAESMPTLSTCLYRRVSGEVPAEKSVGCKQVDNVRWAKTGPRGSIKCNSPAYNAADESGTILTQVGALDCAGNPRVAFGHLDIGAQECQSDKLPGMQVQLR